jgi:hypothetical protein
MSGTMVIDEELINKNVLITIEELRKTPDFDH